MANILNTCIRSSSGDLKSSIENIKQSTFNISTKTVAAIEGKVEVPYYTFPKNIKDTQDGIYAALKDVVGELLENLSKEDKTQTAIIIGTSIVDWHIINAVETSNYPYKRQPFYSKKRSIDSYAKDLSDAFNLNGFTLTINTACTSSVNAILEASNLIDTGIYKYVVVIGLEIFSDMMSSGFYAMQLLNSDTIKPFDKEREGTILGEAISAILLGDDDKSPWKIKGGHSNCNALSITAASEDGTEFVEMMHKALELSNTSATQITAIKTHATGTYANDISEINAIKKVFDNSITFTALKPYVGHTIGACGALEIALFMACIDDGFLPKTLNHSKAILKDYVPLLEHLNCTSGTFMFNFFGFGGNNTSLILQREDR